MECRRDWPTKKAHVKEVDDIMRAIVEIDAKFGQVNKPVVFVARRLRNLPPVTPGEYDIPAILARLCKLERQMSTLHVQRTYAEATSPPPDMNCTTTTSVRDEQQPTLPALQSFDQAPQLAAARRRAASSSEVPSASSWQAETACSERVAPSSNASTSLAEPSAW